MRRRVQRHFRGGGRLARLDSDPLLRGDRVGIAARRLPPHLCDRKEALRAQPHAVICGADGVHDRERALHRAGDTHFHGAGDDFEHNRRGYGAARDGSALAEIYEDFYGMGDNLSRGDGRGRVDLRAAQRDNTGRIVMKLFKKRINFYHLLSSQCDCMSEGLTALYNYCVTKEERFADEVVKIEEDGDMRRRILIDELNNTFITPIERKDIFNLSRQIDEILDYAKATIDELRLFRILPDEAMTDIVGILVDICKHISRAVANMEHHPNIAKDEAIKVKGLENKVGNHYYRALGALFDQDDFHLVFKYREVYRHLNTTSDVADVAMDSLLDVLMQ